MSPSLFTLPSQVKKSFFELMRRVECMDRADNPGAERFSSVRRQPEWLTIEQTAELVFAAGEVDTIQVRTAPLDRSEVRGVVVRQRHFGLFAPYGPLPLYVTEHALVERRFERNVAFEGFVNMVSAHLSWNHYCAWSALHPVLGYERTHNDFATHLGLLSNAPLTDSDPQASGDHAGHCRAAFAGLYVARQRPLAPLRRMLARYFDVPVQVLPRAGRWMTVPNKGTDPRKLGQWRAGGRVLDAQLQTQILIGPLESHAMKQWKRKSACVAALIQITNDYADGHIQPLVKVLIRTHPDMAGRVGAMQLGHDAWAQPGHAIQTLTVYDSFQEPQ